MVTRQHRKGFTHQPSLRQSYRHKQLPPYHHHTLHYSPRHTTTIAPNHSPHHTTSIASTTIPTIVFTTKASTTTPTTPPPQSPPQSAPYPPPQSTPPFGAAPSPEAAISHVNPSLSLASARGTLAPGLMHAEAYVIRGRWA
ncbi:uncharacterized protein [Penaeus vannamei]|uniref:uncharacterized protein n=1 Tax=Penaeus vannamei TaxID=6689 RepID=UPI00387F96C9